MWLSGLHIPESYLTALVQAACRKNGWPLDLSTLYTQVTQYRSEDEVGDRPGQGNEITLTICSIISDELYRLIVFSPAACFVSGLYLEGADWDTEKGCLVKSKPKVLVVELPILKVIPVEARRLRLQVWTTGTTGLHTILYFTIFLFNCRVYFFVLYPRIQYGHRCTPRLCGGMQWVWGWCLRQTCSPPCTFPTGCSRESVYASTLTKDSPQPH